MRTPRVFASLLAFPCPFNEVGFPSVSPFWAVFNLAPFNNLRSDYPLDSRSVEWLILDRIRDTDMVGCLLRRDASASVGAVKLRSKVSRRNFGATQKVPSNAIVPMLGNWGTWHAPNAVWVDCRVREEHFSRPCSVDMAVRSVLFCPRSTTGHFRDDFLRCVRPRTARCCGRMF
jgi:hypothetical protein